MNTFLQRFFRIVIVSAITLTAGLLLSSRDALAQSAVSTGAATLPSMPHRENSGLHAETSVSVGSMAQLAASRIQDSRTSFMTQSLDPSAGVLATFRQTFKPWLGYSVNFGYTYPHYRFTSSAPASTTGTTSKETLQAHMYEISLSYIAEKRLTKQISLFGEAGAGTLGFATNNTGGYLPRRSNAFKPEGIAGFGIDYQLTHELGLRAQYRALFVQYPYPNDDISIRLNTVVSEPTLSLTYTFGKRRHR